MTDYDPRLVDLYDGDNPDGPDHDYYRSLADDLNARRVLDLGCGTGILTVTLTAGDRLVVGVDPSAAMLAYSRARPGAEDVTWVEGYSSDVPGVDFDLVLMTGNVAQHIPDTEWASTLRDVRASLRLGGTLAFESRNPAARAWDDWSSDVRTSRETLHGTLVEWSEATVIDAQTVELVAHNLFARTGETVTDTQHLVFRARERIEADLHGAGFDVDLVSGDWAGTPFTGGEAVMVFAARAR